MKDSTNNEERVANAGVTRRTVLSGAVATAVLGAVGVSVANQRGSKPGKSSKKSEKTASKRMPTIYIPHGGGPCFFMDWTMGPPDTWVRMASWLKSIPANLPARPKALLIVSAHWEQPKPTVLTSAAPPLLFDYSGFPKHTYELQWPAKGAPQVAERIASLLHNSGIATDKDAKRGFDHGVFVPMLLSFPKADIPTLQLSLRRGLDPSEHLAMGAALAPLRDEGVLIIGSGMSYHNMRGFMRRESLAESKQFDAWLHDAVKMSKTQRDAALVNWTKAPAARACHPREEHLLPLMVVAGAAQNDRGATVFSDQVMGVQVSAHRFG